MKGNCKYVVSARAQDAPYFPESFLGVAYMLKYVLGDNEIE
jgi:hypothetical protein